MKKIKKLLKKQSGSALIFAIITLAVVMVLGTALMSLNVADNRESLRQSDSLQAYYLAKSGAVSMGTVIIENAESMTASEFSDFLSSVVNKISEKTEIAEANGYFQVTVLEDETKGLGVRSTGTVRKTSETVTVWLTGSGSSAPVFDFAAFANQYVFLVGGGYIDGDVHSNIDDPSQISFANQWEHFISGDLYVSGSSEKNWEFDDLSVGGDIIPESPKRTFPDPVFPEIPTLPNGGNIIVSSSDVKESDAGYYYPKVKVDGAGTWYIDTNDQDCAIVTDTFKLEGGGHIYVRGTGTLKVFVTSDLSISGGVPFSPETDAEIILYYMGTKKLTLGSGIDLDVSVFVKQAELVLNGGPQLSGSFISEGDKVTISGGAMVHQLVYAPNADMKIDGGGIVNGVVIANELKMSGGGRINYQDISDIDLGDVFSSESSSYAFGIWE